MQHRRRAVEVMAASEADLGPVQALLDANGLPSADVADHFAHFIVARDEDGLVGVAGMEVHGDAGLLRSVCVAEAARGTGLGGRLCDEMERRASARGIGALYLLTTTAQEFFGARDFDVIDRAEAPEAIRQTAEFRSLCPSSAICMRTAPRT
jgi:amino-acid N-acetyltransferase